jgi:hypothetical protein
VAQTNAILGQQYYEAYTKLWFVLHEARPDPAAHFHTIKYIASGHYIPKFEPDTNVVLHCKPPFVAETTRSCPCICFSDFIDASQQ